MVKINTKTTLIIILMLSLAMNLFQFVFYSNHTQIIDASKYKLLNPRRGVYDRDNLLINFQPLRDELTLIGDKNPNISIYFEYLPTGANISVNKDTGFFPASLLKIPVAFAMYKKIEEGIYKTSDTFVFGRKNRNSEFGDLYKTPAGTKITIDQLLFEMIAKSDNTAYETILDKIETWDLNDVYAHVGLNALANIDGLISAKRYSVFLRSLYNATYLSEDSSQKILSILTKTPFNEMLARGFPPDITFAHKVGISENRGVYMDAGIVYSPRRPYLIVVMTKNNSKEDAYKLMNSVSKKVYDYVISQKND